MALVFMDGFGLHATVPDVRRRWADFPTATTSITNKARNSAKSLLIQGSSYTNTLTRACAFGVGNTTKLWFGFDFFYDSGLTLTANAPFLALNSLNNGLRYTTENGIIKIGITSTGAITIGAGSSAVYATSTITLAPDTVYRIECDIKSTGTSGTSYVSVYVDGLLAVTSAGDPAPLSTTGPGVVRFKGCFTSVSGKGCHFGNFVFWDDVAGVGPTTFPQGIVTVDYVPSTNTNLDEITSDGDTTVETVSTNTTYSMSDITVNSDTILAVQPVANVRSTGSFPRQFKMKTINGGLETLSETLSAPASTAYDLRIGAPVGGVTTPTLVNGLQIEVQPI